MMQRKYLLVGGHAVAIHGYPRYTGDIDIWIDATQQNSERLVSALREFGFDLPELNPNLFVGKNRMTRLGREPVKIEILTSISGVAFEEAAGRPRDGHRRNHRTRHLARRSSRQQEGQRKIQGPRGSGQSPGKLTTMPTVENSILIGANDVVNPAARETGSSPIYGMPIINVEQAQSGFVLKRSMASGFADVVNPLFFKEYTCILFADAKQCMCRSWWGSSRGREGMDASFQCAPKLC